MGENLDKSDTGTGFDPTIQSERIAFDLGELTVCDACGRDNPPTRDSCLYCAAPLVVDPDRAAGRALKLRRLEAWENGYNVICLDPSAKNRQEVAGLLSSEPHEIDLLLSHTAPIPLARVENLQTADVIAERLTAVGLDCVVVPDVDLKPDRSQVRLRRLEILSDSLAFEDFNSGKVSTLSSEEITVIVTGVLASSRIDSFEKRAGRRKGSVLGESSTSSDEPVLDLYAADATGFRILTAGFDFSPLGDRMSLMAGENLARLSEDLRSVCPNARFVDNYKEMRQALGIVWEVETRRDAMGLQRSGFGKQDFSTVSSASNQRQFTKYSRLQHHLYGRT